MMAVAVAVLFALTATLAVLFMPHPRPHWSVATLAAGHLVLAVTWLWFDTKLGVLIAVPEAVCAVSLGFSWALVAGPLPHVRLTRFTFAIALCAAAAAGVLLLMTSDGIA